MLFGKVVCQSFFQKTFPIELITKKNQPNILQTSWEVIKGSYVVKDSVLNFEKELSKIFHIDQQYSYEGRGKESKKYKVLSILMLIIKN